MTEAGAKRLVMFDFKKKDVDKSELFKEKFEKDGKLKSPHEVEKAFSLLSSDEKKQVLKEFESVANADEMEVAKDQMLTLDYPKPVSKYYIVYETFNEAIEPIYYWSLAHLKNDWGFAVVHKVTDMFAAAEQSAYYGASAQRLGLAQDKVAQYLATIGKMVKDLFQLVRELRWIDERMGHYKGSIEEKQDKDEIVLKGLWVDLVDGVVGGQRTAANLFIMAQQLQFTTLPDLFFNIHPHTPDEVDKFVNEKAAAFNVSVKNALIRKLNLYLRWRDATYKEMLVRQKFTIDYLKQHFTTIKMYMSWVKPYLKHIQKLTGSVENLGRPELVSAFEGSMIEIEVLGQKLASEKSGDYFTCILLTFEYRTRPALSFAQEGGYHRGPIHVGETRITWRSYGWSQKEIDKYLAMKDYEDLELLASVDQSLKDAMDAMGADLMEYLGEQYSGLNKEEAKKVKALMERENLSIEQAQKVLGIKAKKESPKQAGILDPFVDIGRGFKEMFEMVTPSFGGKKKPVDEEKLKAQKKDAETAAQWTLWQHYKNFKKAHGMITW